MAGRVDWPGRGPTWLGVPALLVAIVGLFILTGIQSRQAASRHLLADGVPAVAEKVQLNVYPNRGTPVVGEVVVTFRTANGPHRSQLSDFEDDDPHGVPEGTHAPAERSRYAPPLAILYDPSNPTVVLAAADAQLWLADRNTPRIGIGLTIAGSVITFSALILLTTNARRRGVAWWQWFSDPPP